MSEMHRPVLCQEVVRLLDPRPEKIYVDGTVGLGGHAQTLLHAEPSIRLIGIDLDPKALSLAEERLSGFGDRVRLVHGNYCDLTRHLTALGVRKIAGFFLDLGVSSLQLDVPERGFSFRRDGPLDMRMDPTCGEMAAQFVSAASEGMLAEALFRYGEERFAKRIARAIVQERAKAPIETTDRLADIVREAIPRRFHPKSIDPATRTFQALRIVVNRELESLEQGLPDGPGERSFGHGASPVPGPMGLSTPGRFRPGDAAFNTEHPIRSRCPSSGKLLIIPTDTNYPPTRHIHLCRS